MTILCAAGRRKREMQQETQIMNADHLFFSPEPGQLALGEMSRILPDLLRGGLKRKLPLQPGIKFPVAESLH